MPATLDRKKPAPPKTRGVCWVYNHATTARLIADNIPAPLIIRIGDLSWYYLVARHGLSWRLTHVRQDDSGCESYVVHLDPPTWCDCPAHRYGRSHCKHTLALRAALNAIGVEP